MYDRLFIHSLAYVLSPSHHLSLLQAEHLVLVLDIVAKDGSVPYISDRESSNFRKSINVAIWG